MLFMAKEERIPRKCNNLHIRVVYTRCDTRVSLLLTSVREKVYTVRAELISRSGYLRCVAHGEPVDSGCRVPEGESYVAVDR
jgi:hypothetical protein